MAVLAIFKFRISKVGQNMLEIQWKHALPDPPPHSGPEEEAGRVQHKRQPDRVRQAEVDAGGEEVALPDVVCQLPPLDALVDHPRPPRMPVERKETVSCSIPQLAFFPVRGAASPAG